MKTNFSAWQWKMKRTWYSAVLSAGTDTLRRTAKSPPTTASGELEERANSGELPCKHKRDYRRCRVQTQQGWVIRFLPLDIDKAPPTYQTTEVLRDDGEGSLSRPENFQRSHIHPPDCEGNFIWVSHIQIRRIQYRDGYLHSYGVRDFIIIRIIGRITWIVWRELNSEC